MSSRALMVGCVARSLPPMMAAPLLFASSAASAQTDPRSSARQLVEQARSFGRERGCRPGETDMSGDIVVCGRRDDQSLPVPEAAGPPLVQTDGAAVNPDGVPCGASGGLRECFEGVNALAVAGAAIGVVRSLLDPDRSLGEGTRLPRRFRGANR